MTYQEGMRAPARTLWVEGTLTFDTSRQVVLTAADVISLNLDEGVDDGLLVGAVLSAKHTLRLAGADDAWLPAAQNWLRTPCAAQPCSCAWARPGRRSRCAPSSSTRSRPNTARPASPSPATTASTRRPPEPLTIP